jgi:uncharacterized phiE125 gp8 family phage protein
MGLVLVTPPAAEPVSRDQVKDQCRITSDSENSRIDRYVVSARAYAENRLGRQLVNATWRLTFDHFPWSSAGRQTFDPYNSHAIVVPRPPLVSVTSIQYVDITGVLQTLGPSTYTVDTDSEPGRIALAPNCYWPATYPQINAVKVTYVAGYGTDGTLVPEEIKLAIEMLAAHFYERREATTEAKLMTVPLAVDDLLDLCRIEQYVYPSERKYP